MLIRDLKKDPTVLEWFYNLNATEQTRKVYLQAIQGFTEFTGLSPDQLLSEAENEEVSGVLSRHRKLKKHLIGFRQSLMGAGLSEHTVRTRIAGVRSFYSAADIVIPKVRGERHKALGIDSNNAIPTKSDLQGCLTVCDLLEAAVLLTGVSSGLAANEISRLTVKQFRGGYDPVTEIATIQMTRAKTQTNFVCFLSPEATRAIRAYLTFRDREIKSCGVRRQRQLDKQKVTDNGFLFISRSISDEYLSTKNEKLRQLTNNAIGKLYQNISEKAGKSSKTGYNTVRSHTARKYYNSALLNAGADSFFVEFTMGHTLDDTRAAYFRASPDKMRDQYQKYIPYLTIEKSLDISTNQDYKAAIERAEKAEAEAVRVSVEREELNRVRAQLAEMQNNFEMLSQLYESEAAGRQKMKKVAFLPDET